MPLLSASSLNNRFTQLASAVFLLLLIAWLWIPSFHGNRQSSSPSSGSSWIPDSLSHPNHDSTTSTEPNHPIDFLIHHADEERSTLLAKETHTLSEATSVYRARRNRPPPPGFDAWFAYAQNHSALIIENFFDQIYHDLAPFWGVPANQTRDQARGFAHRISVRNGTATPFSDGVPRPWVDLWLDMIGTVAEWLPDVDFPLNIMDESRVVVAWEDIDGFMVKAQEEERSVPEEELETNFQSLQALDKTDPQEFDPGFSGEGPYWRQYVKGCKPNSLARNFSVETDFSTPLQLSESYPEGSYEGYVRNWTFTSSPCENPHLQGLHGTFVEPVSISNTQTFFPLFGGSKLPANNEILLPPAMYWTDDPFYSGGEFNGGPWRKKLDRMIWRGSASGGRNRESNWKRFHRHRFISMLNSTSVKSAETTPNETPPNFVLPVRSAYNLAARSLESLPGALANWLKSWSDVAAVHLLCFPDSGSKDCPYTDPYFSALKGMPMQEQYAYKYLPDIDGNSFSGRYRGFLRSTSLPIKATIYKEWHDSRLIPWVHFVPMDNTFIDVYGIMEYFLGNKKSGVKGHDWAAERIALSGKQWAERVLRKEDMAVYVLRLGLEFARVCDERREVMGWRHDSVARIDDNTRQGD